MKKSYLYGKTVVVSGASGGIGFAIAKLLIEKYNCKIIAIARNEQKIIDAIQTLGDNKINFSYKLFDVSIKDNWKNFSNELKEKKINIDVLINNAGFMLPFSKFEKYSEDEIEEIVKTNMCSCLYSIKALLPIIKKSDTPAIINVSSAAGTCAVVGQSMYCATKFAVKGFTETLQQEYGKRIYVGGVYPGFVRTNILDRSYDKSTQNKLVYKVMMPLDKASKKIVKGISKKRRRIVLGLDGKSMAFFGRIFPKLTPTIITKVLKLSKLEMFNDVFD